jgi:hypothetical protein
MASIGVVAREIEAQPRKDMESSRFEGEIVETLHDVRVTLEVLVRHLRLEKEVENAIAARRLKAERSRLEIERSLGHGAEADGDSRR